MKRRKSSQPSPARPGSISTPLYEPLDFVFVRAPLLPLDLYLALSDVTRDGEWRGDPVASVALEDGSLAPCDPRIRRALAVGSLPLLDALERSSPESQDAAYVRGKLLRYLIRMATRPTPYGLFAGVALGRCGERTDLELAPAPPRTRTRPDMTWLYSLILRLEAQPEVRKYLHLTA